MEYIRVVKMLIGHLPVVDLLSIVALTYNLYSKNAFVEGFVHVQMNS